MGKGVTVINRSRYNAVANYLKAVAKKMVEALKDAENIIPQFAIPADVFASSNKDANAVMNTVRQLELDPEGANIVRLQDAGAFADEIASYFGERKSLEQRFLHSQWLSDDMYNRIVVLPNEFAEPLIILWKAYDAIRQNGAETSELRSAWTEIDKKLRAAEIASVGKELRESNPARRVRLTLAPKPVASASPKGRNAEKRQHDRQIRASMQQGKGTASNSKAKKNKKHA